jgi:iron complex outermembrane receptor protein
MSFAEQPVRDHFNAEMPSPNFSWLGLGIVAAASLGLSGTNTASAQSAPATSTLQEVVVTAQKRSQNIQDVPISVTAVGKTGLASIGLQDISKLASQVPSLQVIQYSPTVTSFNIRGVSQNDYTDSQEGPIAFYNDGVYIGSSGAIDGMIFDTDQAEVLRGPQGTLFGRNATGGLIQVSSAKPTKEFEAYGTATFGSYGEIGTVSAISGPINDAVRMRVALTNDFHNGYIQNSAGPDLGAKNFYGARIQLAIDVSPVDSLTLKLEGLENNHEHSAGAYSFASAAPNSEGLGQVFGVSQNPFGTCPGCSAFGYVKPNNNPFSNAEDGPDLFDRHFLSFTVNYVHKFGDDITLTSISNVQRLRKNYAEDTDASPVNVINYYTYQNLYQASEEVRLSGMTPRLNWTVGAYAIKIHTDNTYIEDVIPYQAIFEYGGPLDTESLAVFGQGEYSLTKTLSLIVGLRYSNDWKEYQYTHQTNGLDDLVFDPSTVGSLARRNDGDYSGKLQLSYRPASGIMLYAGVNRGTKSGGFSTPASPPFDINEMSFKPEVLTDYEGGGKLTLFNGSAHLDGSLFHYDYHNYQSFEILPPAIFVSNQNAVLDGGELELSASPMSQLYVSAFASSVYGTVKDVTLPSGLVVNTQMPDAPHLSLGWLINYGIPLGSGKLSLQTDWKYDSTQYFTTFNAPDDREPPRLVGNVRATYSFGSERQWEAAFFINNVSNKYYRVYNGDISSSFGFTQQAYAPPRWFGGSLTLRIN